MTACKSNLKNIGTALDMYATDFGGSFPSKLETLTPKYLKTLPNCPAAASNTYTLATGPKALNNEKGIQNYYHVECHGKYHVDVSIPENYPSYNTVMGLVER